MIRDTNILTYPFKVAKSLIKVHCVIDGEPISKQRPKFAINKGGGVYTPQKTKDAEEYIGWTIKANHRELICDEDSTYGVRVHFYQKSNQRRDIDNMVKLVFDACNKVVWGDDRQVSDLHAHVFRNSDIPHTELCIFTVESDMSQKIYQTCKACGKTFRTYPSWRNRGKVFCSRSCQLLGVRNGITKSCSTCGTKIYRIPCRLNTKHFFCSNKCKQKFGSNIVVCSNCNKEFTRAKSSTKTGKQFCSESCFSQYLKMNPTKYHHGICVNCGNPTSKKKYKTCRVCARAVRYGYAGADVKQGDTQTIITIREVK